uniref:MPN domain-containing protein n=1 Tax=Plectus sambesii TaxID=2011161 RepID=A0A914X3H5_9BILA
MAEVRTSTNAYCKMVLHAFKYPHAAITGLLIAEKKREGGVLHIVDVVPLAHQCTSLSVAVEAALCQVDAHCHSKPPQRLIVGVYFANESLKDTR